MKFSLLKRKVLNKGALYISLFKLRPLLKGLNSTSIVIDCGANIGDITNKFASTGAQVHAFEPDPQAFSILAKRFANTQNVHLNNAAVWVEDTTLDLHFHEDSDGDSEEFTVSSSVISNKLNVSQSNTVAVKAIDLVAFLQQFDQNIAVLKMDVEGAEIEILDRIITSEVYKKVDLMLVETHETKIPGHQEAVAHLKQKLAEKSIDHVKLNWI